MESGTETGTDLLALFAEVEAETGPITHTEPDWKAEAAAYAAAILRPPPAPFDPHRCGRCFGTGHLEHFRHIAGGDCFACEGTGRV